MAVNKIVLNNLRRASGDGHNSELVQCRLRLGARAEQCSVLQGKAPPVVAYKPDFSG
jgi:hypothetical protein